MLGALGEFFAEIFAELGFIVFIEWIFKKTSRKLIALLFLVFIISIAVTLLRYFLK